MKRYQDHDPLHGNGKAIPKPKRPTYHTYRGGRFGVPVDLDRSEYTRAKSENYERAHVGNGQLMSAAMLIAACLGFRRGR